MWHLRKIRFPWETTSDRWWVFWQHQQPQHHCGICIAQELQVLESEFSSSSFSCRHIIYLIFHGCQKSCMSSFFLYVELYASWFVWQGLVLSPHGEWAADVLWASTEDKNIWPITIPTISSLNCCRFFYLISTTVFGIVCLVLFASPKGTTEEPPYVSDVSSQMDNRNNTPIGINQTFSCRAMTKHISPLSSSWLFYVLALS